MFCSECVRFWHYKRCSYREGIAIILKILRGMAKHKSSHYKLSYIYVDTQDNPIWSNTH